MRIVFMGTPDFSVPCLRALLEHGDEVVGVFTQPDKPKGRGYQMIPTPVKKEALSHGIPVYQPTSLRKGEDAESAMQTLRTLAPDLIVVVAYGQILPQSVLDLPKYGCVNVHASLLPQYRGAAPIQRVILNGEVETGVTTMQMAAGLDTGDMLIKSRTAIDPNETAGELHDRLAALGAQTLCDTVDAIADGTLSPEVQDDALSCYAGMITKDMSVLDFSQPAAVVHNTIRGISGTAFMNGRRIKFHRSELTDRTADPAQAGVLVDASELLIACGDGCCVRITELQAEGGKRLRAADFLRGNKLEQGTRFTSSANP